MKVIFVVTTLIAGGAETMLAEVALRGKRDGHNVMVISLRGDQSLGARSFVRGVNPRPGKALWPDSG